MSPRGDACTCHVAGNACVTHVCARVHVSECVRTCARESEYP